MRLTELPAHLRGSRYGSSKELANEYEIIAFLLVVAMAFTVFYGVLKLRQMQTIYDAQCPPKGSR